MLYRQVVLLFTALECAIRKVKKKGGGSEHDTSPSVYANEELNLLG
jgi:hypothetical protein